MNRHLNNAQPLTLDRPNVAVESRGVLTPEVLAIARALHERIKLLNEQQPPTPPPSLGMPQVTHEPPQRKELTIKVALCENPNDPLFASWREAMTERASGAEFGAQETDGTLSFPKPDTVQMRWGNANFLVEPRGMKHLALTLETIVAMDSVQGITSETGRWAQDMCDALSNGDFSRPEDKPAVVRRVPMHDDRAQDQPEL